MKSLEELAGKLTTTDIASLLPKIILEEVEEAARAKRFGRTLVRVNTDLVGKPGRSIHVPKRGKMTAAKVAEGQELNAFTTGVSPTYETIEITPFKVVAMAAITQEAIDSLEFDLVRDHIREAGEALADIEDKEILKALMGVVEEEVSKTNVTKDQWTSLYASDTPIAYLAVKEGAGKLTKVDYEKGKFQVDTTGNYTFIVWKKATSSPEADIEWFKVNTLGSFDYANDMVKGAVTVRSKGFTPNFMVMSSKTFAFILKDEHFIDAARYGSNEPIVNGEVGKIAGMKVLVTDNMPDSAVIFVDSTRAAYLVIKRNIDLKRWDSPRSDSVELYFYYEFAPRVVNPEAVAVAIGMDTLAAASE